MQNTFKWTAAPDFWFLFACMDRSALKINLYRFLKLSVAALNFLAAIYKAFQTKISHKKTQKSGAIVKQEEQKLAKKINFYA